jgi:hypothetical protein
MVRPITLLLSLGLFHCTAIAQGLGPELAELNQLFAGTAQFKLDKHEQLVIDLFDASGRFRQDIVALEHLDPAAMHYSTEEDAVIIGCIAAEGQCFSKEIFKHNTIRRSGRCNLPRPAHDTDGAAVINAFRALIEAAKAQLAANGETHQRPARKN